MGGYAGWTSKFAWLVSEKETCYTRILSRQSSSQHAYRFGEGVRGTKGQVKGWIRTIHRRQVQMLEEGFKRPRQKVAKKEERIREWKKDERLSFVGFSANFLPPPQPLAATFSPNAYYQNLHIGFIFVFITRHYFKLQFLLFSYPRARHPFCCEILNNYRNVIIFESECNSFADIGSAGIKGVCSHWILISSFSDFSCFKMHAVLVVRGTGCAAS